MTDEALDRLTERLDRLERAHRRRTLTSSAMVMVLLAGLASPQQRHASRSRVPMRRRGDEGQCDVMMKEGKTVERICR
jgi:hypothetical protein